VLCRQGRDKLHQGRPRQPRRPVLDCRLTTTHLLSTTTCHNDIAFGLQCVTFMLYPIQQCCALQARQRQSTPSTAQATPVASPGLPTVHNTPPEHYGSSTCYIDVTFGLPRVTSMLHLLCSAGKVETKYTKDGPGNPRGQSWTADCPQHTS
jgi:hypothetical protein